MYTYQTIEKASEGIYKEKGSKFLSFAIPISTESEAREIIKEYKKMYFDARHVCYAYMLSAERNQFKSSDDGEPNGTAGRPILGQINSKNLTNIIVIVVRYFGGILLGTGGLVTAYKEATIDVLNNAKLITKTVEKTIHLTFEYLKLNDVMKIVKDFNVLILHQNFDNKCQIELSISLSEINIFLSKLDKLQDINIRVIQQEN